MKYKPGDEVLVKGEITDLHEGTDHPYFVAVNYDSVHWVSEEKIIPMDKTYSDGLKDAWELAKKICYEPKKRWVFQRRTYGNFRNSYHRRNL